MKYQIYNTPIAESLKTCGTKIETLKLIEFIKLRINPDRLSLDLRGS